MADARLTGVIKLSAARRRNEIHSGTAEFACEIDSVLHAAAAIDAFIGEHTAADDVVIPYLFTHCCVDLQRQAHAVLSDPAIGVFARIGPGQE